ncbi:DUF4124 domain-containing protein [Guyparkeria hydrothermalis]|uniref:DUF4124 domain-containing protein n=1 Tax=Guyparkeria hydrothermalis TaxID=923 RepID=UPI003D9C73B0
MTRMLVAKLSTLILHPSQTSTAWSVVSLEQEGLRSAQEVLAMTRPILITALLCLAGAANAGAYKCTATDGSLTFSDKPCPGQQNEEVDLRANEPTKQQREK